MERIKTACLNCLDSLTYLEDEADCLEAMAYVSEELTELLTDLNKSGNLNGFESQKVGFALKELNRVIVECKPPHEVSEMYTIGRIGTMLEFALSALVD